MKSLIQLLRKLKADNPDCHVAGEFTDRFELSEYGVNFDLTFHSIWDARSIPRGLRSKKTCALINNTYFSAIADHLAQHSILRERDVTGLDLDWAATLTFKKAITECMFRWHPCRTSIATMIEYLMESESLNLCIYEELIKSQEDVSLITHIKSTATYVVAGHELAHFLYNLEGFREKFFPDLDSIKIPFNTDSGIKLHEEVFCDTFGLVYVALGAAQMGFTVDSAITVAKHTLYGALITIVCQESAKKFILDNEDGNFEFTANIEDKLSQIVFRFQHASERAEELIRLEWEGPDHTGITLPFEFSEISFNRAFVAAAEMPCRDIGIRRISGLMADAYVLAGPDSFRHVANNAHQFSKISEDSFRGLKM
ncbi:hypothetical protein [Rubellicoccus peritrichatus]|uniref:Uncharacterized protein n=1 Tax=Rubellicoccus peritrichatus TaxID=3080537 RepID=A0AAQ3L9P8_9BACT|nr:hypothetical protein [Puniceicoccus sp. CR14]WOO40252.1 hypothetical protein RZN69_16655 [Puniceicoccus sp. CR14]